MQSTSKALGGRLLLGAVLFQFSCLKCLSCVLAREAELDKFAPHHLSYTSHPRWPWSAQQRPRHVGWPSPEHPTRRFALEQTGLKGLRGVRKFKARRGELSQYLVHHVRNPAAVRCAPDEARNSADHHSIVKDVDSALTILGILNNPLGRPSRPVDFHPRINHKMSDRQDSSRLGDLSNSGGHETERRTKPTKWMARLTERVADRFIAPDKIQRESLEVPQIGEPMTKGVVDQEMPGCGNRASLFGPHHDLPANQTEAGFDTELGQDSQQVLGDLPCWAIVEREHTLARC
jgi:hypothetical protein